MSAGTYFQFPLSLLAFNRADLRASLHVAVSWSITELAGSDPAEMGDAPAKDPAWGNGWRKSDRSDARIVAAAHLLNVSLGSRFGFQQGMATAQETLRGFEKRFGPDRQVRLAGDILWECINGKVAERDIRVLAGVFAGLGVRPYRRITIDEIIHGASACKSRAVFEQWPERLSALTRDQVRYTLDGLENRRLFVRFTYRQRQTFYASAGMGRENLLAYVTQAKLAKAAATARRSGDAKDSSALVAKVTTTASPPHNSGENPHNSGECPHNSGEIPHAPMTLPNSAPT